MARQSQPFLILGFGMNFLGTPHGWSSYFSIKTRNFGLSMAIPPLLEHVKPWIDGFGVPPKPDLLLGEELQVRTRKKKKKADNADCFHRATCIHLYHSNHWNDGKGNHPKMA